MSFEFFDMKNIIDNSQILLSETVISKERIIKEFSDYMAETIKKGDHSVDVLLHTGSVCFDAITVIFSAISSILSNEISVDELISSLRIGDMVLYNNSRYYFQGKIEEDMQYVLLESFSKDHGLELKGESRIPERYWNRISPYYGDSTQTNGMGIRKSHFKYKDFLSSVLGVDESQIPSVLGTSSVIVTSKEKADFFMKKLAIEYGDKKICLSELVTASYYTDNNELRYAGNPGKTEPLLKFTSSISVARKLILNPEDNYNSGICILGKEYVSRGMSEIPDFINSTSLEYIIISAKLGSEEALNIVNDYENYNLFACTKDYLSGRNTPSLFRSSYTNNLYDQVNAIVNHSIITNYSESSLSWEDCRFFKKELAAFKSYDELGDSKDNFVIQAHSLFNLYSTALFSIALLEKKIDSLLLGVDSPTIKLSNLRQIANGFPKLFQNRANKIVDILEKFHQEQYGSNKKLNDLLHTIESNEYRKIALIVSKEYFESALLAIPQINLFVRLGRLTIKTPSQFNEDEIYDCVIVAGLYEGKSFGIYKCINAKTIVALLYDFEKKFIDRKAKIASKMERSINRKSYIKYDFDDTEEIDENESDIEAKEVEIFENEISDFIHDINETYVLKRYGKAGTSEGSQYSEVSALVKFTNGEIAFLSKYYKPYLYDTVNGKVSEVNPTDLDSGSCVLFTNNNEDTKDIVDAVLNQLLDENLLDDEVSQAYNDSKYWKIVLSIYSTKHGYYASEINQQLQKFGHTTGDQAVRIWMDPESRVVGPREFETFERIGKLTNDFELIENPQRFERACATIRGVRRKILGQIEQAIVGNRGTRNTSSDDPIFNLVAERIDSISCVLQIESISFPEGYSVPANIVNKPIDNEG